MSVREEFDAWAADGRDRGMADRHWHTAKTILAGMPIEDGDRVLDLGSGSGYALRALDSTHDLTAGVGLDGAPEMARNAHEYSRDHPAVTFTVGSFGALPFADDSFDHVFSMEAFYYASDPDATLRELHRVLRPGGTFHCGVNYYEENTYSHDWADRIEVSMTRWSAADYRRGFREAGFHVASQQHVPDRAIEIPPADEFPTDEFDTREAMVERFRELGTLTTVGVAP